MKMSARVLLSILTCGAMALSISGCNDSDSSPASATIGGTVTGLSGSVTLVNNGRGSQVVSADGTFTFAARQSQSSPYAVAVLTQPAGQTCTVTNGSGTVGTSSVTDVSVVCVANTFTLGGTVSGLSGTVVLQRAGGAALSISSNGVFAFPTPVAEGSPYAVSVKTQPAGGTCSVTQGSGIVGSSSVTGITVTCVANAFTIGGTISGLIGTVALQNNGADTQTSSTDGPLTFPTPVTQGKPYAVTVLTQPADETCSVSNGTGTMGAAKITTVAVVCSTNTFSIGGTVSGLLGTLILQDNGGDALTLSANGTFTFATPLAQGNTYLVTVLTQPNTQTCTVANATATLGAANVSSVTVMCAVNAYTVGGTVSGLSGTVTLLDNGGDTLPLSTNGSFAFPTPVAEGSSYDVTVQTQPAVQTCTVTNGSGVMGSSNWTGVNLNCVTNDTTLTVSATGTIPVNNGSATLTVTNTGTTYTAYNVYATLPPGWLAVTQNVSNCAAIAPNGGTCTLTFTSTAPYVAQGGIAITGDNIASPPTTALAFTIDGYLVFSVDTPSSASVIDTADLPNDQWGNYAVTGAQSLADGSSNTSTIAGTGGIGASAAIDCNDSTRGAAAVDTWYLPAICQMGGAGQGAGCTTGLANIYTNLLQLGFGGLNAYYWSSTESSQDPTAAAYGESFVIGGSSSQSLTSKTNLLSVRCARSITY